MLTAVTTSLAHSLCGKALTIATADPAAIAAVREGVLSDVRLAPPLHVSEHDAYLLVEPSAADEPGDPDAITPALLSRSLVVEGTLAVQRGRATLSVANRWEPLALVQEKPFDATVRLRQGSDLVPQLNDLPFARCSTAARLFDRRGLERIVRRRSYVGPSWAPELPDGEEGDADSSWVWSRRTSGAIHVHLAVLGEYEERYALVNPVRVRLWGPHEHRITASPLAGPRKRKAAPPPAPEDAEKKEAPEPEAEGDADGEPDDLEAAEADVVAGTDLPDERLSELPAERESTAPLARRDSLAKWDPLQAYMAEVARHPVLSAEEQHELAVKFATKGDVDAAAALVTSNLRLVVKIAYEYRRAHKNLMDIIQEGNIGLMQAVKRYDPYRGVKLSSYAAWWIRAYILRYILNNARLVKVGTTQAQRKLFFNLAKEKARLSAMGIEPEAKTIAENLKVTPREVEEMDRRIGSPEVSIDAPLSTEDGDRGPTRGDLLRSSTTPADDEIIESQFNDALHQHLDEFGRSLQGKERDIFYRRLIAESPLTLQELGDEFGISRERVRQLEARLQQRLRTFLVDRMGDYLPFEA